MRRRFLLVHNPAAGTAGRTLTSRVVAELERQGATVTRALPPSGMGPVIAAGAAEAFDAVIAAGGDGTFRALAAALERVHVPLGLIPAGTGNVLASEISLRKSPVVIADVLMRGPIVEIEGARANGEPFYLMAGAGFDGAVVRDLDTPWKQRIGKAAYTKPVLAALAAASPELEVTIDGKAYRAGWVVAAKARRYGGLFTIAPGAALAAEDLQVVLFKSEKRSVRVRQLLALGAGLLTSDPSVAFVAGRRISVRSAVPVAVQIDGDGFGVTPLDIAAGGPRVQLIVPPEYASSRR